MKLALDTKNHDIAYADLGAKEDLDQPTALCEARRLGATYVEVYRKPPRGHAAAPLRWLITLRVVDGHVVKAGRDAV
jgi:hypothetical protein